MKSILIAIVLSAVGVIADSALLSCGYTLVNEDHYSQAEIASALCGRTDTCDGGKEWNTLYETVRMSSGPSEWSEIRSTGVFCINGCYEGSGRWNAKCH